MGGKEEETGVGRRWEEGFMNVSQIMHCSVLFKKYRFMKNGHKMTMINQPMRILYFYLTNSVLCTLIISLAGMLNFPNAATICKINQDSV